MNGQTLRIKKVVVAALGVKYLHPPIHLTLFLLLPLLLPYSFLALFLLLTLLPLLLPLLTSLPLPLIFRYIQALPALSPLSFLCLHLCLWGDGAPTNSAAVLPHPIAIVSHVPTTAVLTTLAGTATNFIPPHPAPPLLQLLLLLLATAPPAAPCQLPALPHLRQRVHNAEAAGQQQHAARTPSPESHLYTQRSRQLRAAGESAGRGCCSCSTIRTHLLLLFLLLFLPLLFLHLLLLLLLLV